MAVPRPKFYSEAWAQRMAQLPKSSFATLTSPVGTGSKVLHRAGGGVSIVAKRSYLTTYLEKYSPGASKVFISEHEIGEYFDVQKADKRLKNVGFSVYWRDEIIPLAIWWDAGIDVVPWVPSKILKERIAHHIKDIYERGGDPPWTPSKKMARRGRRKGTESIIRARGEKTMRQTGRLQRQVWNLGEHPAFRVTGHPDRALQASGVLGRYQPQGVQRITMTGLAEAFETPEDASYVWFHELGTTRMPRRPFIFQGVQRGWNDVMRAFDRGYRKAREIGVQGASFSMNEHILVSSAGPVLPIEQKLEAYIPQERLTAFALMWWLLPPSQLWAVIGGASDIGAVLSGELLQARYLVPWLQAFAMGKISSMTRVPLTKKYARRGFRRRMYRGRGQYRRK